MAHDASPCWRKWWGWGVSESKKNDRVKVRTNKGRRLIEEALRCWMEGKETSCALIGGGVQNSTKGKDDIYSFHWQMTLHMYCCFQVSSTDGWACIFPEGFSLVGEKEGLRRNVLICVIQAFISTLCKQVSFYLWTWKWLNLYGEGVKDRNAMPIMLPSA